MIYNDKFYNKVVELLYLRSDWCRPLYHIFFRIKLQKVESKSTLIIYNIYGDCGQNYDSSKQNRPFDIRFTKSCDFHDLLQAIFIQVE